MSRKIEESSNNPIYTLGLSQAFEQENSMMRASITTFSEEGNKNDAETNQDLAGVSIENQE